MRFIYQIHNYLEDGYRDAHGVQTSKAPILWEFILESILIHLPIPYINLS